MWLGFTGKGTNACLRRWDRGRYGSVLPVLQQLCKVADTLHNPLQMACKGVHTHLKSTDASATNLHKVLPLPSTFLCDSNLLQFPLSHFSNEIYVIVASIYHLGLILAEANQI